MSRARVVQRSRYRCGIHLAAVLLTIDEERGENVTPLACALATSSTIRSTPVPARRVERASGIEPGMEPRGVEVARTSWRSLRTSRPIGQKLRSEAPAPAARARMAARGWAAREGRH